MSPSRPARRLLLAAVALSMPLGLLAGCGDDDGDEPAATTTPASATPTTGADDVDEEDDEDATTTVDPDDATTTTTDADETEEADQDADELEADEEVAPDEALPGSTWSATPIEFRDRIGLRVAYRCEPDGETHLVWGDGMYTDDSSVCTAAVHAGLIDLDDGGRVVIEIAPGLEAYEATRAHGVETISYGSWGGSFFFPALGTPEVVSLGGNAPSND